MTIEYILNKLKESKKNNTPLIEIEAVDISVTDDPDEPRLELSVTVFGEKATYIMYECDTIEYNFDVLEYEPWINSDGKIITHLPKPNQGEIVTKAG